MSLNFHVIPNQMKKIKSSSESSSLKIVFIYAVISAIYIYTSDYILETFVTNVDLLTKFQTYKGTGFIVITAALLYILVKRNVDKATSHYQQILDIKETTDTQLKKSHEEYMLFFNHSSLPMWLYDMETLAFLLVNDTACETYGYSQEDYSKMTIRDIRPEEDLPIMEQLILESLNHSENENHTYINILRHKKKNGDIIYVKVKATSIYFKEKLARLVTSVDVTTEINTQNALTEINSKLQLAGEIASLGYWTNDLIHSKIEWSEEVYKIFELDPQTFELTLENIKNCFHPEDRVEFGGNLSTAFKYNIPKESERRIITGSGSIKWILERIHLIKDETGRPIKLNGIVFDVTKRKLYEQEISESNERFKIITRTTNEAIIDWDIKNDTTIWGEGFSTIFGYDLSEYDNYLWSKNIHPEDRERILDDLNKALEDPTQEYFNANFRFLKANGAITCVQHKGIFIRDVNGKATRALGAMIDLTDTLSRIRKIEQQNNVLKDIAWTQSHVVRAPLANLQGLISLLKDNLNSGVTDDKELLDYITDSVDKLDEIIRDIVKKTREIDEM